ncbi:hypothetical protein FSST1_010007 [Fusarium sambucinum]
MAITACIALQFQYMWIDSLCIIQDSEEDWQKEAATMHLVYGNSALNMCMPGAATERDARLIKPLDVRIEQEGEPAKAAYMLSCETFPEGTDYGSKFGPGAPEKSELSAMKLGETKHAHLGSPYEHWWHMIKQYVNCNLTYETDRIIAFSGVAQAFRLLHNIKGQYLAGIWSLNMPEGLLWYRNSSAAFRSDNYKAPSWSWMSIDGPYQMLDECEHATRICCSIGQIYLHLKDEKHDTGLIDGGALRIRGHLVGPITNGPELDEDILLCHVGTEDRADDGFCMVYEDEVGLDGDPFISYLNGLDQESTQVGLTSGAFRQTITFSEAEGSIFCLPVSYYDYPGRLYDSVLCGLILYNPSHQPGIYHRIGYYELNCKAILNIEPQLREDHPLQSILIY